MNSIIESQYIKVKKKTVKDILDLARNHRSINCIVIQIKKYYKLICIHYFCLDILYRYSVIYNFKKKNWFKFKSLSTVVHFIISLDAQTPYVVGMSFFTLNA